VTPKSWLRFKRAIALPLASFFLAKPDWRNHLVRRRESDQHRD
jgi:hypothetical protein